MTVKTKKANQAAPDKSVPYDGPCKIRTVCTSCAVGCGIEAEVHNGVWLRQRIAAEHPVSAGGHCYRGADAIDMVSSPRRLKNPMKKVNGKWINISWDQAIGEIGDKLLGLRGKDGPDVLQFLGSAKVSTEMAYLQRKFAAFWGSNNIDHQGRI
jgi:formate dehydrogenase major subunit